jgi:hypothetical protein
MKKDVNFIHLHSGLELHTSIPNDPHPLLTGTYWRLVVLVIPNLCKFIQISLFPAQSELMSALTWWTGESIAILLNCGVHKLFDGLDGFGKFLQRILVALEKIAQQKETRHRQEQPHQQKGLRSHYARSSR